MRTDARIRLGIGALLLLAVTLLALAWTRPLLTITVKAELPSPVPVTITLLDETRSVFTMVDRLVETDYLVIAVLIVFFGIILPVAKNIGVALLLLARPGGRALRLASIMQFVGRFAMVDVFAIGIVVSTLAARTVGGAGVSTVTELLVGLYLFIAYILVSFVIDVLLALWLRPSKDAPALTEDGRIA